MITSRFVLLKFLCKLKVIKNFKKIKQNNLPFISAYATADDSGNSTVILENINKLV